jgi:hypothetical protein
LQEDLQPVFIISLKLEYLCVRSGNNPEKKAGYMFWFPQLVFFAKLVIFLLAVLSLMLTTQSSLCLRYV